MESDSYMPIPNQFWDIAPQADRFLVCYPRSASRWLQLALTDMAFCLSGLDPSQIYEQRYERETAVGRSAMKAGAVGKFCPDIYTLVQKGQFERHPELLPSLLPVFRSHSLASLDRCPNYKLVYLFRPPASMLVSYIHFARKEGYLDKNPASVELFCKHRLEEWVVHIEHAVSRMELAGERACMVRYLDQGPFSVAQLRKVVTVLDIPASDALIGQALTRLKDMLERINLSGRFSYARGSNQENLRSVPGITESFAETVYNSTQAVFERACRIEEQIW